MANDAKLSTRCVHAGELSDAHGSPHTPVYTTTTFAFPSTAAILDVVEGRTDGSLYTRYGLNPTIKSLEAKLAALEGAEAALAFAAEAVQRSEGTDVGGLEGVVGRFGTERVGTEPPHVVHRPPDEGVFGPDVSVRGTQSQVGQVDPVEVRLAGASESPRHHERTVTVPCIEGWIVQWNS